MLFYKLTEDRLSRDCATDVFGVDDLDGDAPRCPECGGTFGSLRWLPPYKIEVIRRGKRFGDIIRAPGNDHIVSNAFMRAWNECKLRGLDGFDSVEIVRVKPISAAPYVPTYWHITIKRGPAAVDMDRSSFAYSIRHPPTCKYCGEGFDAVAGFEIDETTWTGDDIFIPRNMPGTIVVTQRFVDMITKYHLTHAILIPTEKYIFDPLHLIVPYSKHKN